MSDCTQYDYFKCINTASNNPALKDPLMFLCLVMI